MTVWVQTHGLHVKSLFQPLHCAFVIKRRRSKKAEEELREEWIRTRNSRKAPEWSLMVAFVAVWPNCIEYIHCTK